MNVPDDAAGALAAVAEADAARLDSRVITLTGSPGRDDRR